MSYIAQFAIMGGVTALVLPTMPDHNAVDAGLLGWFAALMTTGLGARALGWFGRLGVIAAYGVR